MKTTDILNSKPEGLPEEQLNICFLLSSTLYCRSFIKIYPDLIIYRKIDKHLCNELWLEINKMYNMK